MSIPLYQIPLPAYLAGDVAELWAHEVIPLPAHDADQHGVFGGQGLGSTPAPAQVRRVTEQPGRADAVAKRIARIHEYKSQD